MDTFLLEIGTEEIPAGYIKPAFAFRNAPTHSGRVAGISDVESSDAACVADITIIRSYRQIARVGGAARS